MTSARTLLAAAVTAALLAGCTPDGSDPPGGSSGDAASTPGGAAGDAAGADGTDEASPSDAAEPARPEEGACYRIDFDALAQTSNDSEPVRCGRGHQAETIHVGGIDSVVGDAALESDQARSRLERECRSRLARHLGGTREQRDLSRFEVVWFTPTPEQVEQGADWFRCDLVALAGHDRLHSLSRRTKGILDRPRALATYGLCGTAAPGAPRFERVICDRRHSWRAIATIPLRGGERYPGTARVRAAGNAECRNLARAQARNPLEFRYGWEWPTREQWENGQRFGYCWVPA